MHPPPYCRRHRLASPDRSLAARAARQFVQYMFAPRSPRPEAVACRWRASTGRHVAQDWRRPRSSTTGGAQTSLETSLQRNAFTLPVPLPRHLQRTRVVEGSMTPAVKFQKISWLTARSKALCILLPKKCRRRSRRQLNGPRPAARISSSFVLLGFDE